MKESEQTKPLPNLQYYIDFYELEKKKYAPLNSMYGYPENSQEFAELAKNNALNNAIAKISEDYSSKPEGLDKVAQYLSPIIGTAAGCGAYIALENSASSNAGAIGCMAGAGTMIIVEYVAYRHMKNSQKFKEKFEAGEKLVAQIRNHRKNDKTVIENKKFESSQKEILSANK